MNTATPSELVPEVNHAKNFYKITYRIPHWLFSENFESLTPKISQNSPPLLLYPSNFRRGHCPPSISKFQALPQSKIEFSAPGSALKIYLCMEPQPSKKKQNRYLLTPNTWICHIYPVFSGLVWSLCYDAFNDRVPWVTKIFSSIRKCILMSLGEKFIEWRPKNLPYCISIHNMFKSFRNFWMFV